MVPIEIGVFEEVIQGFEELPKLFSGDHQGNVFGSVFPGHVLLNFHFQSMSPKRSETPNGMAGISSGSA